jgi:hypothetical protein
MGPENDTCNFRLDCSSWSTVKSSGRKIHFLRQKIDGGGAGRRKRMDYKLIPTLWNLGETPARRRKSGAGAEREMSAPPKISRREDCSAADVRRFGDFEKGVSGM